MTTILWQYWKHAKPKEVMALSVASFQRNLRGDFRLATCGDYFAGLKQVNSPRICHGQFKRRFGRSMPQHLTRDFDKIIKLQAAIESPIVSDDFIRLYDDHFLLRETDVSELGYSISKRKQYNFEKATTKTVWQDLRHKSYLALRDRGLPTYTFATHNAIRYNKQKSQSMIDEFRLFDVPLLFEVLYQNLYFDDPSIKCSDQKEFAFITCVNDLMGCTIDDCRLLNVQNTGVNKTLQHVRRVLGLDKWTWPKGFEKYLSDNNLQANGETKAFIETVLKNFMVPT
jgi:hypothetical protein